MPSTKDEFDSNGYVVLTSLIEQGQARALHAYSLKVAASGTARQGQQVPGTPSPYGDPFMDNLLVRLLPRIEETCGRRLYPTYSLFRVYRNGDVLQRHKDRPACEISLSVCLGYRAETPWPLCIEGPNGVFAAALQPGDALLYKGVECPHWRDAFTGESASQVFLHYVDQDGPFAEWKLDKRPDLGRLLVSATHSSPEELTGP